LNAGNPPQRLISPCTQSIQALPFNNCWPHNIIDIQRLIKRTFNTRTSSKTLLSAIPPR